MIAAQLQILRWSIRSSLVLALCLGPGIVLSADSGRKSPNHLALLPAICSNSFALSATLGLQIAMDTA